MAKQAVAVNPYLFFYRFQTRTAFTSAAKLVIIAATPIKIDPSRFIIADSVLAGYVLGMFSSMSCRKGDSLSWA